MITLIEYITKLIVTLITGATRTFWSLIGLALAAWALEYTILILRQEEKEERNPLHTQGGWRGRSN